MKNYQAQNVDAYLAGVGPEARRHLAELRKIIKATIPQVEEKISWGVPFYRYHGLLVGLAAFKNHVSFGLVNAFSDQDRQKLADKGYQSGKKTIQIRFDQEVPTAIIKQLLKAKAKSNQAKKAAN